MAVRGTAPAAREDAPRAAGGSRAQASPLSKRKRSRRRRSFRFTREGKVFVAVTVGVGLAAVNTGNNLLYLVLGLMLSLLLVSGTLSDLALYNVRVRRRLPERTFAQTPMLIELELHNEKRRLPSYALEVEDRAAGETKAERRCFYLKVAPGGRQTATYRRVAARRGWLRFEGYVVRTRYPFGLIEKGRRIDDPGEVLVYPTIEARTLPDMGRGGRGDEVPTARLGPAGEIQGLRPYRPGDEARAIHWRRSAAMDELIVREYAEEARARVTLLLDQAEPTHPDEDAAKAWRDELERRVSAAASLADAALAGGAAVEVQVRGQRSPLVAPGSPPDPIWRFLALLESIPAGEAPALESAERALLVDAAFTRSGNDAESA